MVNRKTILLLIVLAAVFCGGYLVFVGFGGSDEERVRALVREELPGCFEEGDLGGIRTLLTEDFQLTRHHETMTRKGLCDVLRFHFLRGSRFFISGRMEKLDFSGSGSEATVLWKGEVRMKGKGRNWRDRGTGELVFKKISGDWLLKKAVAF